MKDFEAKFDTNNIQSVELNLLDSQDEISIEQKQEKNSIIKIYI